MQNLIKIDLHTHSTTSYDGGIRYDQYVKLLLKDPQLVTAVTDHNDIDLAFQLQKEFGKRVIVGEEILTLEGEVIGLFLKKKILPGATALKTCQQIKAQGALVYIPHPFEKTRKGLSKEALKQIEHLVDIVEVYNARSKEPWRQKKLITLLANSKFAVASSSDAHGIRGIGSAYSVVNDVPTAKTLNKLLGTASLVCKHAKLRSYLDPLKNKIKHRLQ